MSEGLGSSTENHHRCEAAEHPMLSHIVKNHCEKHKEKNYCQYSSFQGP